MLTLRFVKVTQGYVKCWFNSAGNNESLDFQIILLSTKKEEG
jgi:hypothetical protein